MNETSRHTTGRLTIWKENYALIAYDAGNSKNTINYLRYLLAQSLHQRLLIFWDGARYYRSQETQSFLAKINQGLPEEEWKIHCVRFAPNCPEQNWIEDIWSQAKTGVRRFCTLDLLHESGSMCQFIVE